MSSRFIYEDEEKFDEFSKQQSYRLCQRVKDMDIPLEYNLAGAAYNDIMNTTQYPLLNFGK